MHFKDPACPRGLTSQALSRTQQQQNLLQDVSEAQLRLRTPHPLALHQTLLQFPPALRHVRPRYQHHQQLDLLRAFKNIQNLQNLNILKQKLNNLKNLKNLKKY